MAKLSTEALRKMIEQWLSTPQIRTHLRSWLEDGKEPEAGSSDRLWVLWCDGKQWKRREKRTLKDEAEDVFGYKEPFFDTDFAGFANADMIARFFNDRKAGERCVFRRFEPDNDFADNFRLEVVTTPDDDEVVCWRIIVD